MNIRRVLTKFGNLNKIFKNGLFKRFLNFQTEILNIHKYFTN